MQSFSHLEVPTKLLIFDFHYNFDVPRVGFLILVWMLIIIPCIHLYPGPRLVLTVDIFFFLCHMGVFDELFTFV